MGTVMMNVLESNMYLGFLVSSSVSSHILTCEIYVSGGFRFVNTDAIIFCFKSMSKNRKRWGRNLITI